jgi:rhodanese-related sulfurtransferase
MTNPPIVKTISCHDLYRVSLDGPIALIDVRTTEEFEQAHAAPARNVPLDKLDPFALIKSQTSAPEQPIFFICAVGARSAWACELMMAVGYENVVNVEGGTQAWYIAGLPTHTSPTR